MPNAQALTPEEEAEARQRKIEEYIEKCATCHYLMSKSYVF